MKKPEFQINSYWLWAKVLLVALLILYSTSGTTQTNRLYFDHLTSKNGLSQNDVNCIMQDSKGFMWFGTNDGLNRYDGYEFTIFKPQPADPHSIPSNLILSLAEDSAGRIWIGTAGHGLCCYNPDNRKFYTFRLCPEDQPGCRYHHIKNLLTDQQGHLWVATIAGLQVFQLKFPGKKEGELALNVSKELIPPELQQGYFEALYLDEEGNIWAGCMRGLYRLSPPQREGAAFLSEYIPIDPGLPQLHVRAITRDMYKALVLATTQGLYYQSGSTETNLPLFSPFYRESFVSVSVDSLNQIWSAGSLGLRQFQKGPGDPLPHNTGVYTRNLQEQNSLSKDVLRTLYTDRNSMVWVGTNGGGINKFDPQKMTSLHFKKSLKEGSINYDKIRAVFEDSQENLWIGTEGGGLNFLPVENSRTDYEHFRHLKEPSYVFAFTEVEEHHQNYVYFGGQTNPGLYKMKVPSSPKEFHADNVEVIHQIPHPVFSLLNDANETLWIGTYHAGLLRMKLPPPEGDPVIEHFQHAQNDPGSLSNNIIRSLLKDSKGNIWVGTGVGLNQIPAQSTRNEKPTFIRYRHHADDPHSLSHDYILALYESKEGDLWIGTFGGGLNKFVPETQDRPAHFIHYTEEHGLANNVVKGILEDEAGNLWIASNKGISRFDPRSGSFKNYDTDDGLQSDEFSELACFRRSNGEMIFGGVNGFNVFTPESFSDNTYLPQVVFTGLQVLNKPIEAGELLNGRTILEQSISRTRHIHLKHHENSFSLKFAAIHYSAPDKNQYKYKLEGFDPDWIHIDASKRFATYTNLEPGEYTIYVKASNNDGVWNEQPASIHISISPPFWRSWWAYLIYGLLVIGMLAAFRRYTIIGIREKHQLMLEHLEKERTEELHQMKLRFFTNISHEFRTPLTLITGPLEYLIKKGQQLDEQQRRQQYDFIQKNAGFLLRLVNQLLDFHKLDQGKMKLQVQKGNVMDFIREVTEPFQFVASKKQIEYQVLTDSEEITMWFDPDILEKTLYNLLSNAFKYTPVGGQILVEVSSCQLHIPPHNPGQTYLEIRVRDTGPGIPPEKRKHLFERFYQSPHPAGGHRPGTGIGLAFTKSLIELHHGQIQLDDKQQQGTCFVVRLPLAKSHYSSTEIARQPAIDATVAAPPLPAPAYLNPDENGKHEAVNENQPLLLIVDDHPDIRTFIRQAFASEYTFLEAENGAKALQLAREHIPELIISDVMMPVMDGFELCQKLKTDPQTSHIPLVLLTAKSSDESELQGFVTGADGYVRKPFNVEILKARVQNILNWRQELRARYRREILLQPEEIAVTSTDEIFLKKAMEIVNEHMEDPDFNVETMVREIGMSRSKLYLKLKALTGQSTSEFIRSVRLKRAVQLLEKSDMTVKEVMYMTGFNTASYFAKCFKKQFGVSPSEYLKKEHVVEI